MSAVAVCGFECPLDGVGDVMDLLSVNRERLRRQDFLSVDFLDADKDFASGRFSEDFPNGHDYFPLPFLAGAVVVVVVVSC